MMASKNYLRECKINSYLPSCLTVQGLFEGWAERFPDAVAVVYEDKELTYGILNEKANQLASYLISQHDVRPDTLVALCVDKSEQMLIGILGILKAGGAYVPIDPSYPEERIRYILGDTKTKVVLSTKARKQRLETIGYSADILAMDGEEFQKQLSLHPITNPEIDIKNTNLAYVIYTSGTTGHPKGVMIEHKSVVNYTENLLGRGLISSEDAVDFSTNIGFDLTVTTTIGALCLGAKVVVYGGLLEDLEAYKQHLIQNRISVVKLTPGYFELFVDDLSKTQIMKVILGGEKLSPSLLKKLTTVNDGIRIYDEYGPTETTVGAYRIQVHPASESTQKIVYDNYTLYVVDSNLALLPMGAIGELYIGGEGLARGYLNRSDLTAEKFIVNPFQTIEEKNQNKNARLYKTGDLVCWRENGILEYRGRNDSQVKIRGYRIELSEIEAALVEHGDVHQAVVATYLKHDSNAKIVAYIVPGDFSPSEVELKEFLEKKLPSYMVPQFMVFLNKLPLTTNGKVDRNALPDPEFTCVDTYVEPRNEIEIQVCSLWAEVLGLSVDKIGIRDDFFKLGGDSIVSIQLVSKLRQKLGIHVNVKDIFDYKTIERLFDAVLSKTQKNEIQLKTEQGLLTGEFPLLPVQDWFFESRHKNPHHWNQSFLVKVPNLDIKKLQRSVKEFAEFHDGFRLRYKKNDSSFYTQTYDNEPLEALKVLDLKSHGEDLQEILTRWQSGFNIEKGPLYSIGYIHGFADGSARLHFALHHLIVDAVSWRILAEDLRDIYNGTFNRVKGSSYRQWVQTVRDYSDSHQEEKTYWKNILSDYKNTNRIVDESRKPQISINFTQKETECLLRETNKAYNTQVNDILLTALGYALFDMTNSQINHIVLEGHGREEIDPGIDITRTIGWFTTLYPVRLEMGDDFGSSIKWTKENLRRIPNKGIGYGALVGYKDFRSQLPKISFNYLGQFDHENQDLWTITSETSGTSVDPVNNDHNIITMNGLIIDGILTFDIVSKLDQQTTQNFAQAFKSSLQNIIHHCAHQPRSYLTVSDIDNIISQDYLDKLQESKDIEGCYLANSLQQGFIYHALNQGDKDDAYLVQSIWEYNDLLDTDKLKEAWAYAQRKYSTLRLRFNWEEQLVQVIDKECDLNWRYLDLSREKDSKKQELEIKKIQEKDRKERYALDQSGLFRVYIIKQREDLYTCIFSHHHAILDGWSNSILFKYIHDTYLKFTAQHPISQLIDHSYGDTQVYLQERLNDHKDYWDERLFRIETNGNLCGLLQSNSDVQSLSQYKRIVRPEKQEFTIKGETYEGLKKLSQENGLTLNAILQSMWHKVLSIYENSNQTLVGATVSGRNLPIDNIEDSVGLYINTLPLLVNHRTENMNSNKTIMELVREVQWDINELNNRSNISLAKLQKNGERLFNSLFMYENYYISRNKENYNKLGIRFKEEIEKLDYPLGVVVNELNDKLIFTLEYAGELFNKDAIRRLLSTVELLLEQFGQNPHFALKDLNYLRKNEWEKIIDKGSGHSYLPSSGTVQALFEIWAERFPDAVAVVYEDKELTYGILNEKANQLASYLINQHDIKPDRLVALCMDKSEQMLIGILGILKAGGAYVPIDPSYPEERIRYILGDTKTKVVLSTKARKQRLETIGYSADILAMDGEEFQKQLSLHPITNPEIDIKNTNLAYVIYTSGTTGHPKGVMIEHKSVVNYTENLLGRGLISSEDAVDFSTNIGFDLTVTTTIGALCLGAKVVVYGGLLEDLEAYKQHLIQNRISVVKLTPGYFELFVDDLSKTQIMKVILGGEKLSPSLLKKLTTVNDGIRIYDEYGPTETTVGAYRIQVHPASESTQKIVYDNYTLYVVDSNLALLPMGAIGELYIGGEGLARGYLNRSDLTAEKFIVNPFQTIEEKNQNKNARLYKTGDLVCWRENGILEYRGRNDSQVKIRGYRIELSEIEAALVEHGDVHQAVVATYLKHDSNAKIVAYIVPGDFSPSEVELKEFLEKKLPSYMVPQFMVFLNKLPLTTNGKVDRNALPDPEFTCVDTYVEPRNEIEIQVCSLWAEVLGLSVDKIGIRDDFFKLGGDSIVSIQLVSKLRQKLGIHVNVKDIFDYKTIERLFDAVLSKTQKNEIQLKTEQGLLTGEFPLLPVQDWFFESRHKNPHHWNQSFLVKVPNLDIKKLQRSVKEFAEFHDGFRLRYKKNDSSFYTQTYDNEPLEALKVLDLKSHGEDLQEILTRWQSGFNIEKGPLYSIGYIHGFADGSARLHFALHHLIVDAVSWRILAEDLRDIYNGTFNRVKGSSYRQWVQTVRDYSDSHQEEKTYWKNILSDYKNTNRIVDESRKPQISINFTQKETECLLRETNKAYNTQVNDILLTALGYALFDMTNSQINHIVLEGHGREEIDPGIDITRTIGWFTTLYPVRLEMGDDFGSSIKWTKENLRRIPNKGIGYGALVGYKDFRSQLPKISFNYLGQFDHENQDLWTITSETSGTSVDPVNNDHNIITMNGLIIDGILTFDIVSKLDQQTTQNFAQAFKSSLQNIIHHCALKSIPEPTMSDFNDFEPYVVLDMPALGNSDNLFIFPPALGGAESYFNNVSQKLSSQNLILFNNYYQYLQEKMGDIYRNNITYEKLAVDYISCLKSVQAKGPYNIFGWSFGAVLAFEVAKQLMQGGDEVLNLFLVDPLFNYKILATKIFETEELNNINSRYNPIFNEKIFDDTNIVLFKTNKKIKNNDVKSLYIEKIIKISEYYVENCKYNNLDLLLPRKKFKTIELDNNHLSWVFSNSAVDTICDVIKEFLSLKRPSENQSTSGYRNCA